MVQRVANLAIAELRERIQRLEGGAVGKGEVLPFGVVEIDEKLPGGGLSVGALHEVAGGGVDAVHGAAAALFVAGIMARTKGDVLWCMTRPEPDVVLRQMTEGNNVIKDYENTGLTLRAHPMSFWYGKSRAAPKA